GSEFAQLARPRHGDWPNPGAFPETLLQVAFLASVASDCERLRTDQRNRPLPDSNRGMADLQSAAGGLQGTIRQGFTAEPSGSMSASMLHVAENKPDLAGTIDAQLGQAGLPDAIRAPSWP